MKDKTMWYQIGITALGCLGLMISFVTAFSSAIQPFLAVLLYLIILPLTIFVVYHPQKKLLWAYLAVFVIILIVNASTLHLSIQALYNGIVDTYSANDHYIFNKYNLSSIIANGGASAITWYATKAMLICFSIYTLVTTILIAHQKHYMLVVLLSVALFSTTILYKTSPFYISMMMLFTFLVLLLCLSRLHSLMNVTQNIEIYLQRMIVGSVVFSLILMVLVPKPLYQKISRVETLKTNIILKIESIFLNQTTNKGEVNLKDAGNRVYLNATHAIVNSTVKQQLYLKQYSGEKFADDMWKQYPKDQYENKLIQWNTIPSWIESYRMATTRLTYDNLTIYDKRIDPMYALQPYFVSINSVPNEMKHDAYLTADEEIIRYDFLRNERLETIGHARANSAYVAFAGQKYTEVPAEIKALFEDLGIYQSMSKAKSNAGMLYPLITQYLENNTEYTLSPGATPEGKEFVEYFLTENKKGYCVHYATTATLMFRYMGVPARYVEGYRVDTSKFDSDGNAIVKDSDGHAWVEVFDEDKGWVPMEVTPASSLSDIDTTKPDPSTTQTPSQGNDIDNEQGTINQTPSENDQTTADIIAGHDEVDLHLNILIPAVGTILVIVGVFVRRQRKYRYYQQRLQQVDRRRAVIAVELLLEKWQSYGKVECQGIEALLNKAQYSTHKIEEEEYQQVMQCYYQNRKRILQGCKPWIKVFMYLIKAM